MDLNLAFAKLGAEALEQANLLIIKLHRLLPPDGFYRGVTSGRV